MGLVNDLTNLVTELMTVPNLDVLSDRGAHPIVSAGKIVGFEDEDGVPLLMY